MTASPPPKYEALPYADPGVELARCVRAWRKRLDPDEIPGFQQAWPGSRRRPRVSQEQVAALIGYSTHWYSRLELGDQQNYSSDFLRRVAHVLRLSADEMRLLFLLAGKQLPTSTRRTTPDGLEPVLDAQPWPTYLSDEAWDLVGHNEQMRSWFPWVVQDDANVMRWVFTYPEARQQLVRWETEWAPQMLAQMRAGQLRYPDNQRLHSVITEILDVNKDARELWEKPLAKFHPDGDRRSLYLPRHREPHPIQVVALEPFRAPGHRLVMLVPNSFQQA
ncbi:helix-turn-helix domain-containing protein [Actinoplanes sp. LDG1-06]|uniref:Helix-turn-helix domain-containing protein n=1 Tax=Paractinoplanes ovalisporus TaxID=2810368 RepID=A0ABS2AVI0_9ACTN|nr:helix-turn-helix transcriptional regulator [Actinoplanes ovalisporus]MBM2623879.1 helix-turn-helix domain-containing protein [Actinoplanes ovalisporus]